jgi:hypothetical protein
VDTGCAEQAPIALIRSLSPGNDVVRIDSAAGVIIAAPMPFARSPRRQARLAAEGLAIAGTDVPVELLGAVAGLDERETVAALDGLAVSGTP